MLRIILQVNIHNENQKLWVMKAVMISGVVGSDFNMKEKKLTVIGDVDPGKVWMRIKRKYYSTIISVEMDFEEREREEEEFRLKEQEEKIREEVEMSHGIFNTRYRSRHHQQDHSNSYVVPYQHPYPTLW
ncbi:hypothetical protein LINPERHAP2_LOCUS40033 [Linum perenne]